jgi:hypothetical protein
MKHVPTSYLQILALPSALRHPEIHLGAARAEAAPRSSRFRSMSLRRFLRAPGVGFPPMRSPSLAWSPSQPSWRWS